MKKYLKVINLFFQTAFARQLEYKANLIIDLVSVCGSIVGSIFILSLFYKGNNNLGGWSWEEALIIQSLFIILSGITNILFRPNLTEIIEHIREGTLDFIILKPIDSQFTLSFRTFAPAGLSEILVGISLLIFLVFKANIYINPLSILFFIVVFGSGIIIIYSIWFLVATTSIWFVQTMSISEVLRNLLISSKYPIDAFPATLKLLFTYLIPISFLTTFPAKTILGNFEIINILTSLLLAFIAFTLSRKFWKFALGHYTSASS